MRGASHETFFDYNFPSSPSSMRSTLNDLTCYDCMVLGHILLSVGVDNLERPTQKKDQYITNYDINLQTFDLNDLVFPV